MFFNIIDRLCHYFLAMVITLFVGMVYCAFRYWGDIHWDVLLKIAGLVGYGMFLKDLAIWAYEGWKEEQKKED